MRLGSLARFHRRFMPSHLSLGSGDSLYGSSSFLSKVFLHCPDFSSSSSSWVVSFGFPSVCSGFSFPLSFCSLCVHGYGAFLFPTTFFPCRIISGGPLSIASLRQFVILLPGSCFPFIFIVTPSGVPWRSSVWFLIFLSSLLALVASSSSVGFLSSSSGFSHPSVARLLGFSSISSLLGSPFWLAAGLPPWLFSFRVPFLHRFIWPSPAPSLSLLAFPSSCGVTVLCPVCFFGGGVVLLVSMTCCSLGFLALSSLGYLGASFPVLPAVCMPFCLSLAISFLHFFLLWSPSRRFGVCLPWLLSLPFQWAPISFSVYGRLVDLPGFPALRLLPWFTFLSLSFSSPLPFLL